MVGGKEETVTVGELLLGRLHDLGVRHIFGVPGDYAMEFTDQVMAFDGIDWIGSSNELNAGYTADGYARIAGIGATATQYGPGELSVLNALAGAMAESVPVVSIVGGPSTEIMRRRTSVHHSLVDGDFDHWARMACEVTVAQASLTAEHALRDIDRVLGACWSQQRPVYIRIPGDVAVASVPRPARPFRRPEPVTNAAQLDAFAAAAHRRLAGAQRPVLLVGNVPVRLGLAPAVAAFASECNWPVAAQALGRGLFDEADSRYVGVYSGLESRAAVREVVEGADVVVCLGTTFFDWNGLFTAELDPDRIINLGPDAASVAGTRFGPIAMAAALGRLHQLAVRRTSGWSSGVIQSKGLSELDRAGSKSITHERLWPAIEAQLRPGDVVVAEVGTAFFGLEMMRLPTGVSVLAAPIWSSAGYAIPAAFGAGVAGPDRRVVLITGDGGVQMSPQELGHMFDFGQLAIVFMVNNRGYTTERVLEKAIGEESQGYAEIPDWRYGKLLAVFAEEEDFVARTVRTEAELAEILSDIDEPPERLTFVEVVVDPTDVPEGMPEWSREASAAIYHAKFPAPARLPWSGLN
ncbi:alpha-keto acid decarboxylase family protein [Salinispora sp. H7-4]|uniref:alpha-keto acid decarboxylase family protein n=1 Tax=Salinispora sp. H7-4 TaxID=2748321 RepID=UPI0015D1ED94|nr:thiamine pyrophosphate-binding protein [Salinispora sp. H7-4]NYT94190.1 alpha-keto acid decarboxylase family protein [Salinispora sp. H7-4]